MSDHHANGSAPATSERLSLMNYAPPIVLGVALTFLSSWLGLVLAPLVQIGDQGPIPTLEGGLDQYPNPSVGRLELGRQVYIENGCLYCHSQQIRPEPFGADIARGWGPRRTTPTDYIYDKPHLLGTSRTGPDLTNIGARQPSAEWHHRHLYWPPSTSPGSIMPSFRFLYETRKIVGEPSDRRIVDFEGVPEHLQPPPGYQIIPSEKATALVAYLISLDRTQDLPVAGAPTP